jgi:hypothetical protein
MPSREPESPAGKDYVERFKVFSDFVEKQLRRLLATMIVLLFLSQLLLQFEVFRRLALRVEQLEGFRQEIGQLEHR